MSTTVCSKRGIRLAAGATSCLSCGPHRPVTATASAGVVKPAIAIAVFGGGLVVLLGALALFRSGALSPTATPAPGTAVTPTGATAPAAAVPSSPVSIEAQSPPLASSPAAPAAPAPVPPPFSKTYETREYAVFDVSPEEAVVTVDGTVIGTADEWDDMAGGKKYAFKGAGIHYVKLSLDKHKTMWIRFIVKPTADTDEADVDLKLEKVERKDK